MYPVTCTGDEPQINLACVKLTMLHAPAAQIIATKGGMGPGVQTQLAGVSVGPGYLIIEFLFCWCAVQLQLLQLLVTPVHQGGYFVRKGLNPQLPRGILSPFSFPQQCKCQLDVPVVLRCALSLTHVNQTACSSMTSSH